MQTKTQNKRLAVVTGASRGIGSAVLSELTANGFDVIGIGGRNPPPPCYKSLQADLLDPVSTAALIGEINALGRPVDVLVNNAAIAGGQGQLGTEQDLKRFADICHINLQATYQLTTGLLGCLRDEAGCIINVGSLLSLRGVGDQPAYTAAKHALKGLTRSLALRLASRRITVNLVCPGWTDTEMARTRAAEMGCDFGDLAKGVPLGRILRPAEVAALVVFLCGANARNITGQTLVIDGGASL